MGLGATYRYLGVLLCTVSFMGGAFAAQSPAVLFDDPADGTEETVRTALAAHELRVRTTTVNLSLLAAPASKEVPAQEIVLNLFPDVQFVAVKTEAWETPDGMSWRGGLTGEPGGRASFAVYEGRVAGNIVTADGRWFELRPWNNAHRIAELDTSAPVRCETGAAQVRTFAEEAPRFDSRQSSELIDVMVVYTGEAREAAGGTAAIEALIRLAIDEANLAYQNSAVSQQIRLVHDQEVLYTESGDNVVHLNHLTGPQDGHMDEVQVLRNNYGADGVILLVATGGAGLSWLMAPPSPGFSESAYGVVNQTYAASFHVFTHELGHIMGCSHERMAADAQPGAYPFSHAYVTSGISTLMNFVSSHETLGSFSNPGLSLNGQPLGLPPGDPDAADNASTLNLTSSTVAGFRANRFYVSPANFNVGNEAGVATFTVNVIGRGETSWELTLEEGGDWVHFATGRNGNNTGEFDVAYSENQSGATRVARIRIEAFGAIQGVTTVSIIQAACQLPGAPIQFIASNGDYGDHIHLAWHAVSGATGYRIYRNTRPERGSAVPVTDWMDGLAYDDFEVLASTGGVGCGGAKSALYYYWVEARNDCGLSGATGPVAGVAGTKQRQAQGMTWHMLAAFVLLTLLGRRGTQRGDTTPSCR